MKTEVLEKLFIEKYPVYEVYGKPLSEYFDIFKSGYELSELKIELAELKIAELGYEIEKLTRENNQLKGE